MNEIRQKFSSVFFTLGGICWGSLFYWWRYGGEFKTLVESMVIGFVFLLLGAFLADKKP